MVSRAKNRAHSHFKMRLIVQIRGGEGGMHGVRIHTWQSAKEEMNWQHRMRPVRWKDCYDTFCIRPNVVRLRLDCSFTKKHGAILIEGTDQHKIQHKYFVLRRFHAAGTKLPAEKCQNWFPNTQIGKHGGQGWRRE